MVDSLVSKLSSLWNVSLDCMLTFLAVFSIKLSLLCFLCFLKTIALKWQYLVHDSVSGLCSWHRIHFSNPQGGFPCPHYYSISAFEWDGDYKHHWLHIRQTRLGRQEWLERQVVSVWFLTPDWFQEKKKLSRSCCLKMVPFILC